MLTNRFTTYLPQIFEDACMASNTFQLEAAKLALEEHGFLQLQDSEIGEHIRTFQSRGFPYGTILALELLTEHVIFDPVSNDIILLMAHLTVFKRVRDILKTFSPDFVLAHSLRYTAKPQRFFRFSSGGPNTPLLIVAHQWAKGSRVDYWIGSHKVALPVLATDLDRDQRKVKEPLLENTKNALVEAGCKPQPFYFPEGGLIIADARVAFEHTEGYEFANVFFPRDLLPPIPMSIPYSPEMADKVRSMKDKSGTIGINFELSKPTDLTD
ncbi:hypothetical protein PG993_014243 [Apiospora rasikravindrae]|uniref:Uncharacterized protein n=1 Tax=Apiospora rasikravindrae TaxID=990691 RepID=A0ABR1RNE2_9PEZI